MLACASSKALATLSRLLEVMIGSKLPRHLQVGLLLTSALEKKAEMKHSIYCISTVTACREPLHTYLQQSISSNLQKIHAHLDDISVQRAGRANLRADLSLSADTHSFGRTAVQSHPQVSSHVCEGFFDPKPGDSAVGPVSALEAVEASGRLARVLQ